MLGDCKLERRSRSGRKADGDFHRSNSEINQFGVSIF